MIRSGRSRPLDCGRCIGFFPYQEAPAPPPVLGTGVERHPSTPISFGLQALELVNAGWRIGGYGSAKRNLAVLDVPGRRSYLLWLATEGYYRASCVAFVCDAVALVLEEGEDLLQIHLMAEGTYFDPGEIPWHEPLPKWAPFTSSERKFFGQLDPLSSHFPNSLLTGSLAPFLTSSLGFIV